MRALGFCSFGCVGQMTPLVDFFNTLFGLCPFFLCYLEYLDPFVMGLSLKSRLPRVAFVASRIVVRGHCDGDSVFLCLLLVVGFLIFS